MASRNADLLRRVEKAPLIGRRSAVIYCLPLVFIALAGACSAASDVGSDAAVLESPVSLHLEQVYGADTAPEGAIIGGIRGIALGRNGDVYVLEAFQGRLVAFDGEGSVAWIAGGRGSGPGEFSNEGPLAFDGVSTLYISNRRGSIVDSWDINGRYVGTYSLRALLGRPTAQVAGFIAPSYLVLVTGLRGQLGSAVSVVDVGNGDWELVSQFKAGAGPEELPEYTNLRATAPRIIVGNDSILVGNFGIYEARVYDSAGSVLRAFSRELDTLEMPRRADRGRRSFAPSFGFVSPPMPFQGGYWLIQVSWPGEGTNVDEIMRQWLVDPSAPRSVQMMNSVDVFDSSGDLVSSVVTEGEQPDEGFFFAFGTDMRLYTIVGDPFPQVRRYRVETEE